MPARFTRSVSITLVHVGVFLNSYCSGDNVEFWTLCLFINYMWEEGNKRGNQPRKMWKQASASADRLQGSTASSPPDIHQTKISWHMKGENSFSVCLFCNDLLQNMKAFFLFVFVVFLLGISCLPGIERNQPGQMVNHDNSSLRGSLELIGLKGNVTWSPTLRKYVLLLLFTNLPKAFVYWIRAHMRGNSKEEQVEEDPGRWRSVLERRGMKVSRKKTENVCEWRRGRWKGDNEGTCLTSEDEDRTVNTKSIPLIREDSLATFPLETNATPVRFV